jgi:hypothetical protein
LNSTACPSFRVLDGLSFVQGAVTLALDRAEMNEDVIVTFLTGDKAKSLGIVEPLYRAVYTITHTTFLGLAYCFYYALPPPVPAET